MQARGVAAVVYRRSDADEWRDAEMIGDHESGAVILRQVAPFYRGVWLEPRGNVRLVGPVFVVPE